MADDNLNLGGSFKGASYNASREADAIGHSGSFVKAKADAQRVSQKNDK